MSHVVCVSELKRLDWKYRFERKISLLSLKCIWMASSCYNLLEHDVYSSSTIRKTVKIVELKNSIRNDIASYNLTKLWVEFLSSLQMLK